LKRVLVALDSGLEALDIRAFRVTREAVRLAHGLA
jgi:hypothetical protein